MEENKTETNIINNTELTSKKNDWKILSGILTVIIIGLLIYMFVGKGLTGNSISEKEANTKILEYLNSRTGGGVESISTKDIGNLYEVTVSYQQNKIPVYVTKDGKYFVQGAILMNEEKSNNENQVYNTPKEVPKSDKPVAEAFVFSYCPYGLQFQKAMEPVYELLKNKADINLVAIGAMHGEYEKIETLRLICIEKNYGKDKLWTYLNEFMASSEIDKCGSSTECSTPLVEKIMTAKGIDKTKINNCMKNDAETIYKQQNDRASELGISGSPTFVINGVQVNVARNPEAIKKAICDAFKTAPSECSKNLSTASVSAGFGSASAASSSSAQC